MDLEIKYQNGLMVVHLEQFLDYGSIGKVKKLVKLIQQSFTPDELYKLKEYVEQQLEQCEPRMKEDAKYVVGYQPKLKFSSKQLETYVYYREKFKRNSDDWKKYNELVKQYRQEVREIKTLINSKNIDFNRCVKNKGFYEKVLQNLS